MTSLVYQYPIIFFQYFTNKKRSMVLLEPRYEQKPYFQKKL